MKEIGIRKAIQLFGGTNIEIHKGYHYQYGFFEKNGTLFYVNTRDDRMKIGNQLNVYYRTAKNREDFHGGTNRFDFLQILNRLGFAITKYPKIR